MVALSPFLPFLSTSASTHRLFSIGPCGSSIKWLSQVEMSKSPRMAVIARLLLSMMYKRMDYFQEGLDRSSQDFSSANNYFGYSKSSRTKPDDWYHLWCTAIITRHQCYGPASRDLFRYEEVMSAQFKLFDKHLPDLYALQIKYLEEKHETKKAALVVKTRNKQIMNTGLGSRFIMIQRIIDALEIEVIIHSSCLPPLT
jgi:hypothetical protein